MQPPSFFISFQAGPRGCVYRSKTTRADKCFAGYRRRERRLRQIICVGLVLTENEIKFVEKKKNIRLFMALGRGARRRIVFFWIGG